MKPNSKLFMTNGVNLEILFYKTPVSPKHRNGKFC